MKKLSLLLVLFVGFVPPSIAGAFDGPSDRTGFCIKTETRYDAYGVARLNRHGVAGSYQNDAIGLVVTASTGVAFLREPHAKVDTQYFGLGGSYRLFKIGAVDVGIASELSVIPPFRAEWVAAGLGFVAPRGGIEFNNGLLLQTRATKNLLVYGGPAYLLFANTVHEHGFGAFVGAAYQLTDKVSVGTSITGADRVHAAGSVSYNF